MYIHTEVIAIFNTMTCALRTYVLYNAVLRLCSCVDCELWNIAKRRQMSIKIELLRTAHFYARTFMAYNAN